MDAARKANAPKCNHLVVVPWTTKGRPAISPNKEPSPERPTPYVPEWDKNPHFGPDEPAEVLTELFKESFGFLIPTYDKLSLFLMAVTLILLYLGNIEMQNQLRDWMQGNRTENLPVTQYSIIESLVFFTAFNFFLILSIILLYRLFKRWKEPDFIKEIMLVFTVLINAIIGIIAGVYVLSNTTAFNWLLVFPIWNIINCVLLLLMLFFNIIDEEYISDRDATLVQIILGLVAVLIIFVFCNYVFKLYWAITFSICIIYTTSFDRALQSVLPGLTYRGDKQTP